MIGLDKLKAALARLNVKSALPELFRLLGDAYVRDVRNRIRTQDGGNWAKPSKWIVAKKGEDRVLRGAERYVVARVTSQGLYIGDDAPGYTLNQHDKGFRNKLIGPKDRREGKAVILELLRPGALGVRRKDFHFVPKKAGLTPARKIWPSEQEVSRIGEPVATRWMQQLLRKVQA